MKTSKKTVVGSAFNFFLVFGLLIAVNCNSTPLIGNGWMIAVGFLIRIGLPVLLGIIGAIFTSRLLEWYEQTRTGKAGNED
ncbi:hypothetical protein H3J60_004573 [Salmonella enterica]|nr:hypothetical protein [Salmonella enterica]